MTKEPFSISTIVLLHSLFLASVASCKDGIQVEEKPGATMTAKPWRQYVQTCCDTLIEIGTDRYGEVHSPLIMAVMDVKTRTSPAEPKRYGCLVRLEEDRLHRRAERGSNLWYDQCLLRSLYRLSEVTSDPKYKEAADDYISYFFTHCKKPEDDRSVWNNGMPAWGTHIYWDCYEDRPGGDGGGSGPHEILVYLPAWSEMYRIHPDQVKKAIDGIWSWHVVDKATGMHNRHDDGQRGCDFAFSGGSFSLAFAFMHSVTGKAEYLNKAKRVADWHWRHRNKDTGLVPDAPSTGDRYDATHCMTCVTGPFATQLLRCSEVSGDPVFMEMAIHYIKAYDQWGWDEEAGSYWGMLALGGTPVQGGVELDSQGNPIPGQTRKDQSNYGAWAPAGHVDIWRTTIYSYEFPLVAAQAAIYAYEMTSKDDGKGDSELLAIAERWARAVEKELPPRTGRRWKRELHEALPEASRTGGTYAENYGRAISFFVHLYRATRDEVYLQRAQGLAKEAVDKLFDNDLFRGHPAKPYYEATDGVGLLLYALLDLDDPEFPLPLSL